MTTEGIGQTIFDNFCGVWNVNQDFLVKIYTYYDGQVLAKYRVMIMLPKKLGLKGEMPAGEARCMASAYQIAVAAAITMIQEHKSQALEGSTHTIIPHETSN